MDISALLDRAKKRGGITSDRKLGLHIGIEGSNITGWRKGKFWPSDNSLIAVAEMAGVDPTPLVLELNILRSTGAAVSIYSDLLTRLGQPEDLVAAE